LRFGSRKYNVFLFFADIEAPLLWHWENWIATEPRLTPLMSSTRGKTALRVFQDAPRPDSAFKDTISFGQLGWNERSHMKWTHGSPQTASNSIEWNFHGCEIWAPNPNLCEKENTPPDGYLIIHNQSNANTSRPKPKFSYAVLLAIACDATELHAHIPSALSELDQLTRPILRAQNQRHWGSSKCQRTKQHIGALNDSFLSGGPIRSDYALDAPLDLNCLLGSWEIFTP